MAAILNLAQFKERTIVPPEDVDLVEAKRPNYILRRLTYWSSLIESRLRKRYAIPFAVMPDTPELVVGWLVDIVTPEVYEARGWNPSDAQSRDVIQARGDALDALKEAADGELGLYDLPLRESNPASAISQGGPFGYAEPSPYDWTDTQREALRGR